ncbi:hypothetical protein NFI95_04225 [Acetobacteraceae bacterium KSS8]|uniref:Uncharacterized protein n=1 Tax=Endosaccharibacter trunci TaxID=2812733 RepID=A0ABT1W453_9PROT|nr:hypothetical protein [Acetobacteraceae bacterium KSS8]
MRFVLVTLLLAAGVLALPALAHGTGARAAQIGRHRASVSAPGAHHAIRPVRIALHSRHRRLGGSLVRCTSLQQPRGNGRMASGHHGAGTFAPTSQAVFFAHAGDRCVWHAGTTVHG